MTPKEKELLVKLRGYLETCAQFTCAACNHACAKKDLDGAYVWRPKSVLAKRLVKDKAGVYVLCRDCSRKPESATEPLIEATLAKGGIFG